MKHMPGVFLAVICVLFFANGFARSTEATTTDKTFGQMKLVDEIDFSTDQSGRMFIDFPAGSSKVEGILGENCRVIPNTNKGTAFFAYRLGAGKGLKPGACYLLDIKFPEDEPRSMMILNWGCEGARGIHTGGAIGDAMKGRYVANNPESIDVPLSGGFEHFRQVFFMHNRTLEIQRPRNDATRPVKIEDGFWVIIAQLPSQNAPLSKGAAVSSIRLYEVLDEKKAYLELNLPPEGLPRRHIFWREEMADDVLGIKCADINMRGVDERVDWYEYKIRLMKILGIDTFCKDLLEFGHNQGWDSSKYGGDKWVNQSGQPGLWSQIVSLVGKHGLNVLPYYEYRGSIGQDEKQSLGKQKTPRRLDGGDTYTHVAFCEDNKVDITTPEAIEDTKKILEITIVDEKKKANFIGAWFRPRPSHNPISFNEKNFELFSAEANDGKPITRSHLLMDEKLLNKYYEWWFGRRRQYLEALRDYLRENVGPDAFVLYTTDASEPGISMPSALVGKGEPEPWTFKDPVVTDNVELWQGILKGEFAAKNGIKPVAIDKIVANGVYLETLKSWHSNWGEWDWKHAAPPADPENYQDVDGVMLSHTINRLYTVSSPATFEAFRTKSGLAVVRHYSLNENEAMGETEKDAPLGYFVADVERTGPYCMMAETVAMANGDPTLLGYLYGNNNTPGFPEYRRNFYQAFLALPALPSTRLDAASENAKVVIREIDAGSHGKYYSISNLSMQEEKGVAIKLSGSGAVYDAATGKKIADSAQALKLDLYPFQLRSLLVK